MIGHDQPSIGQTPTFAELLTAEEQQVKAGAAGCGHTCPGCHSGMTCLRATHDPQTQPHAGRDNSGSWAQWAGPCDDQAVKAAQEFLDGAAR